MTPLTIVFFLMMIWPADLLAAENANASSTIPWSLFIIILSGIIGFIVGTLKSFREEKQKAYGDIIPPILKMAYNPRDEVDEKEYSKALAKLWLYGSKRVTQKMEHALAVLHNPSKRGEVTGALQEAVVEMRRDIQLFPWQKLKPTDVGHLYTRIAGAAAEKNTKNT